MGKAGANWRALLDEAAKEFKNWIDSEPTMSVGYILQARLEQREKLYGDAYAGWVSEGVQLIRKWFGEKNE